MRRQLSFSADYHKHPRRAAFDFYPTPPEAVHALLSVESFEGTVWESACGDGALSEALIETGHAVISSDLIDRGYGYAHVDFLKERSAWATNIITNPPYGRGLADRFIEHALELTEQTGGAVAMLLNLISLCHPTRHDMWTARPPTAIYGLDELICWPNGNPSEAGYRTMQHRYMWCIWRPQRRATQPRFWWLSMRDFRTGRSTRSQFPTQ
jgi:hypothetical protein